MSKRKKNPRKVNFISHNVASHNKNQCTSNKANQSALIRTTNHFQFNEKYPITQGWHPPVPEQSGLLRGVLSLEHARHYLYDLIKFTQNLFPSSDCGRVCVPSSHTKTKFDFLICLKMSPMPRRKRERFYNNFVFVFGCAFHSVPAPNHKSISGILFQAIRLYVDSFNFHPLMKI